MADAIITFGRTALGHATFVPLKRGAGGRSEIVPIGAESAVSELAAAEGEDVVKVYVAEDAWVQIASDPTAAAPDTAEPNPVGWFLAAGSFDEFAVETGEKVAVVAA